MQFEQTSEKKFNRRVDSTNAKCESDLGSGRYANYYANNGDGDCVARIDQSLSVFEIAVDRTTNN
jgi:hypothetical protein